MNPNVHSLHLLRKGIIRKKPNYAKPAALQERQAGKLSYLRKWAATCEGHFKRAYTGKSPKSAITAKCLDCSGYQRLEVTGCIVYECPLWIYRPYQLPEQP